jgi:CheY-like chemotaxis protein
MSTRPRVVVASPHKIEREMLAAWLTSEGMEPIAVATAAAAGHGVASRVYDLLIADAGFANTDGVYAASHGRAQTPSIVIGEPGGADEARAFRQGAMYIARPVDRTAFLCSVSLALMDGRPPRRSPRKPISRTAITVDGVASYLLDVSNEGLRVELPRRGGPSPSPIFIVNVPVLGVALSVQRVWVSSAPASVGAAAAWCGATLAQNSYRAEQLWRSFVASVVG